MGDLTLAIETAAGAHDGQVDKAGKAYILHPLRVMLAMWTDLERVTAVLHDVVEDCPGYSVAGIRLMFGHQVADAIDALTKRPGEVYADYLIRVASNPVARRVKQADLRDNADLSRIATPSSHDYARTEKYRAAMKILEAMWPAP